MINFRVKGIVVLSEESNKQRVETTCQPEQYDYGKFGWIKDPEGNKGELWEPADEKL